MQDSEVRRHDLMVPCIGDDGWFLGVMMLGCLLGGVIVAVMRELSPGLSLINGGLPGVFGMLLAVFVIHYRLGRVVQDDARTSAQAALACLGRSTVRNVIAWGTPAFARPLCEALWPEYGAALLRVRSTDGPAAPSPVPFDFPFEPVLLRANDPALRLMLDRSSGWRERFAEAMEHSQLRTGASRRATVALFAVGFLLGLGFAAFVLVDTFRSLLQWRMPELLPSFSLLALLLLVMAYFQRGTQWLLVPGGIMVRYGPRWRTRWRVAVFAAREAQLIYAEWAELLIVSDGRGRVFARKVRPVEAEAALRAWLCPFPPPAVERLSDWGEAER